MSVHARTLRPADYAGRLTQAELADLLRVAVQQCGRPDGPPASLSHVMDLAAARLGRTLSEVALWQVAETVVNANGLPAVVHGGDPLTAVTAAIAAAQEQPSDALHALLVEAWMACEPEPRSGAGQQRANLEDLERADLARLTLAGRYFLLAHDDVGDLLVSERVCALGLAGALLAEMLLAHSIRFVPANGSLVADGAVETPTLISPVAQDIAGRLREPCPAQRVLDYLASDAYERVRGVLLYAGILTPRESPRLLRAPRTLFPPTRPRLTERVFNAVTALPTTDAARLDLQDAALVALVRASGLASAAGRQWWMADAVPAEHAMARHPGLGHLIGQVGAAVTVTVAVRQR